MDMFSVFIDNCFSLLQQTVVNLPLIGTLASSLLSSRMELEPAGACHSLASELDLSSLNATILSSTYFHNASQEATLGVCEPTANVGAGTCRVQLMVNTSKISAVTAEVWLPTAWKKRSLTIGNGGLGGCIDYDNLAYGASLGFASIATNNGHDGNTGVYFTNPEVLADFTSRSIHTAVLVGKALIEGYYERKPRRSYYIGCSTGGRQGIYAAMHHPGDFDGILAGAPATDFNALLGWTGMVTRHVGAPHGAASASFISEKLWKAVNAEVLRQCDALDGVKDGIITEPDACDFRPEELICKGGRASASSSCLSLQQVEALRKVYEPLYGPQGQLLGPRFSPGAELSWLAQSTLFSGNPFMYTDHWVKYAILNDSSFDFSNFGITDIMRMIEADPGDISTFSGDLSAFRARGGKLLSYHGRKDDVIPSARSKEHYNLVARTLGLRSSEIDDFYRLFLIPGLEHCWSGPGAVRFGQTGREVPKLANASATGTGHKPDNILLALVDWVERGRAPATITGQSEDGKSTRMHCRYPQRSVWNGNEYVCIV